MSYLKTKMATDWSKKDPFRDKVIRVLLFFIPEANPHCHHKFHLINEWLIEFDNEDLPFREIGIDNQGRPIIAEPDNRNYGFWLDTNMEYSDFKGIEVAKNEFERSWNKYFTESSNNVNASK